MVPKTRKTTSRASQTMADLLAKEENRINILKKGDRLKAVITQIFPKRVYFDVGAKTEGVIFGRELERVRDFIKTLKVGDQVSAVVGNPEDSRGQILLNLYNQAQGAAWGFYEDKLKSGEIVEVTGRDQNAGGILVDAPFSLAGFIPGSCLGIKWVGEEAGLVGKKIKVKVIEVNKDKNRLVFSERAVSEEKEIAKELSILEKIKIGDVLKAKIHKVAPYGLFVKIEKDKVELEGLVHISEIAWEKVDDLTKRYHIGGKIQVKVLGKQNDRLQLSVKQLSQDPWQDIVKKYPKDKEFKGIVTKVISYGWLVSLKEGIEGLVHISKVPVGRKIRAGEKIDCFIDSVDPNNRRISLGLVLKKKPVEYK